MIRSASLSGDLAMSKSLGGEEARDQFFGDRAALFGRRTRFDPGEGTPRPSQVVIVVVGLQGAGDRHQQSHIRIGNTAVGHDWNSVGC